MERDNAKLPINIFQALSERDISKFLEREGVYPGNFRVAGDAPLGRAVRVEYLLHFFSDKRKSSKNHNIGASRWAPGAILFENKKQSMPFLSKLKPISKNSWSSQIFFLVSSNTVTLSMISFPT